MVTDNFRSQLLSWPECLECVALLCTNAALRHLSALHTSCTGVLTVALAVVMQVSPAATWAHRQQRVRWRLPPLAPGATGDVKAYFEPDTAGDPLADERRGGLTAIAVEEAVCRCVGCQNTLCAKHCARCQPRAIFFRGIDSDSGAWCCL